MYIDILKNNIIFIPRTIRQKKNVSIVTLLKEIGYFSEYEVISEMLISQELSKFPECIDEWIIYSEDKRTNTGFFIKQEGKEYIVGYLGENVKFKQMRFSNKIEACASYIKNEIEEIRKLC